MKGGTQGGVGEWYRQFSCHFLGTDASHSICFIVRCCSPAATLNGAESALRAMAPWSITTSNWSTAALNQSGETDREGAGFDRHDSLVPSPPNPEQIVTRPGLWPATAPDRSHRSFALEKGRAAGSAPPRLAAARGRQSEMSPRVLDLLGMSLPVSAG